MAQARGKGNAGDATYQNGSTNQGSDGPDSTCRPVGENQEAEDRGDHGVKKEPAPAGKWFHLEG